jgi:hypothetical protein
LKGRLCASDAGEERQWHTHGLDRGKAGGVRGVGKRSMPSGRRAGGSGEPFVSGGSSGNGNRLQPGTGTGDYSNPHGVRPPRIGRVGRVVGTLQGTDPGSCGKAQGTAFSVWVGWAPRRGRTDSSRGVPGGVATQRIPGSPALRAAEALRQKFPGKGPSRPWGFWRVDGKTGQQIAGRERVCGN